MSVSIDFKKIKLEAIIFTFLGILNEKDLKEKLNEKVECSKKVILNIDKNKKFNNVLLKNKIKFLVKDIIKEVEELKQIEYSEYDYNKIIENKEDIEEIDKGIQDLYERYKIKVDKKKYIKSYLKYYSFDSGEKEIKEISTAPESSNEIVQVETQTVLEESCCNDESICKCCQKHTLQITENIQYFESGNKYKELVYKEDSDVIYGSQIYMNESFFKGFFQKNYDFRFGAYNYFKCKCCQKVEIRGDFKFNENYKTKKDKFIINGYAETQHFDKDDKIVKIESGEYYNGTFIKDYGTVYGPCSKCGINKKNIICGTCGYMCLKCHQKLHLKYNRENKILRHNNVYYFDYDIIYEFSRYDIGIREFIIEENDSLFIVKYNTKTKNIDYSNKIKFEPNVIQNRTTGIEPLTDSIFDLFSKSTDMLKMKFDNIKDIVDNDILFKTELDMILQ